MSESKKDRVEELLREGLDFYGADELGKALQAWEQVLAIDPDNAEAQDYIETADQRSVPGSASTPEQAGPPDAVVACEAAAPPAAPPVLLGVLGEARERLESEDYEGALGFLQSANPEERSRLEIQATVELVRSHLYARYRDRVGRFESVPELRADTATITKFNLPPDAGFVLSLIDGATSVGDMLSVSGMDPFDALRILQGLLEVEILGDARMNESLSLLSFMDAPLLVGDPDGGVIYVNPAFEQTFGVDASRARGEELAAMFSGGGREAVLGAVAKVCSGGGTQRFRLREDGRGYLVIASPIEADADQVGVIILLTDEPISDEKLMTFQREIGEPLGEAHGCLEELVERTSLEDDPLRLPAEKGMAAIERARKCSDGLSALLASREKAKPRVESFDPVQALRAAVARIDSDLSTSGVELVMMMPAQLPAGVGDAERVELALTQLLQERIFQSPSGASLTLAARLTPTQRGEGLLISVTDPERSPAAGLHSSQVESEFESFGGEMLTLTHPIAGRVTSIQLPLV